VNWHVKAAGLGMSIFKALDLFFDLHDAAAPAPSKIGLQVFEDTTGRVLAPIQALDSQAGTPLLSVTESWGFTAR